jgi:hypothetical protein
VRHEPFAAQNVTFSQSAWMVTTSSLMVGTTLTAADTVSR